MISCGEGRCIHRPSFFDTIQWGKNHKQETRE